MLDINFYMKFDEVVDRINNKELGTKEEVFQALENIRSENPIVYNIETTNRCNMRCKMCPRTTMMTRNIEDIDKETFIKVVNQLKPHNQSDWGNWKKYCEKKYGIKESDAASENHFFYMSFQK